MSAPVDVLAVLDELRVGWYGEMSRQTMPPEILGAWMRLDVARAAVADLIEAVSDQMQWLDAPQEKYATDAVMLRKADARVRAALARVGGAK